MSCDTVNGTCMTSPLYDVINESDVTMNTTYVMVNNKTYNSTGLGNQTLGNQTFILVWYLQVIYMVAYAAMIVVAAGGNLIVVWIVMGHKRMRTVTNYFLVNLAVADVLITVFNSTVNSFYAFYNDWWFGLVYCKFAQFIGPCTISASCFTFMAIAIDRYVVIVHPLKPRLPARGVMGTIAVIWLTSCTITMPYLLYAETYTYRNSRTICAIKWPDMPELALSEPSLESPEQQLEYAKQLENGITDFAYNMFLLLINYAIPLLTVGVTYARVCVELWGSQAIGERSSAHDSSIKSKRKVVKMMVVVVIIFGICWLPQHAFLIISSRYTEILISEWVQPVYLLCLWLAMSNSMYNPIVYCLMNARFRCGFKYALRWLPCIRWRSSDAEAFWKYTSSRHSANDHSRTVTFTSNLTPRIGNDFHLKGSPTSPHSRHPLNDSSGRSLGSWRYECSNF